MDAQQARDGGGDQQQHAEGRDLLRAEAGDEAPVKKLGTNMASACHWMTQLESFTEKPQPSMATGVAVITSIMMP